MITRAQQQRAVQYAWELCKNTGIALRDEEIEHIEVADLGLGEFETSGLMILTLKITKEVGIKMIALYPWQNCPEHIHPPQGDYPGKEETFRGLWGQAWLYVPGEPAPHPRARVPEHRKGYYTSWHEVDLAPGNQYTSAPNEWHWFQAGSEGAVILSISTRPTDYQDGFRDPGVQRRTAIVEED
jgi:D-lyxose ketol-isomerase